MGANEAIGAIKRQKHVSYVQKYSFLKLVLSTRTCFFLSDRLSSPAPFPCTLTRLLSLTTVSSPPAHLVLHNPLLHRTLQLPAVRYFPAAAHIPAVRPETQLAPCSRSPSPSQATIVAQNGAHSLQEVLRAAGREIKPCTGHVMAVEPPDWLST